MEEGPKTFELTYRQLQAELRKGRNVDPACLPSEKKAGARFGESNGRKYVQNHLGQWTWEYADRSAKHRAKVDAKKKKGKKGKKG